MFLLALMMMATPIKLPCPVVDGACLRSIATKGAEDAALRMQAAKVIAELDIYMVAAAEQGLMGVQYQLEFVVQQPSRPLFFLVEEELRKRKGLRVDRIYQPSAWSKRALNITWGFE